MGSKIFGKLIFSCFAVIALAGCASSKFGDSDPDWYRIMYSELEFFGDSDHPLTDQEVANFKLLTGKSPTMWGRYLCNYRSHRDMVSDEVGVFQRNNLELFVVIGTTERDVTNKGKSGADEAACVKQQLEALRSAPGGDTIPKEPLVFLDVEQKWSLSSEYIKTLYDALVSQGVLSPNSDRFGIYLSTKPQAGVQDAIRMAQANGVPISVGWYDRYLGDKYCGPPQWWQENNIDRMGKIEFKQEFLQYAEECFAYTDSADKAFDLSIKRPPTHGGRGEDPLPDKARRRSS